jgi:probable LLM family oxidoreductase
MAMGLELGIIAFADMPSGVPGAAGRRLRELLAEIELADAVGLDVFGVGEHHRPDYAVSAPAIVLAAASSVTKRIKLSSAVTVLSSEDPVRVYQQYATIDLLSGGRAEIMAGRGSFIESFPLFGQDLDDYDSLFTENLDLLLRVRASERVNWPGGHRAAIDDRGVYPRADRELPVWIAVGGTPQSVVRAGALALPLTIAIIGGDPARFVPLVDLYREAGRRSGHAPDKLRVAVNQHGFVGEDRASAADVFYPPYAEVMSRIGRERGWPGLSRAGFDAGMGPDGHLLVGSPEEVAARIVSEHRIFRNDRFMLQMGVGPVPHDAIMRSIELFGTKVAPIVRDALGEGR